MSVLIDKNRADILFYLTPVTLAAIAYFRSDDPQLHFQIFAKAFSFIWISIFSLSAFGEFVLNPIFQFRKIQSEKSANDPTSKKLYLQEIKGMTGTVLVMSQLIAWPLQFLHQGKPTSFVDTFQESMPFGSVTLFIVKMLIITLAADAYTYFKHYSLHCRHLYAIHATHHQFYQPTIFAAFALHPFESLYTFAPIVLFCIPGLNIHAKTYIPYLALWGGLNLYLHSGMVYGPLERLLPILFINTSVFHNAHHELTRTHFGEMLYLWDWILGTDEARQKNLRGLFGIRPWLEYFMKQPGFGVSTFLIRDPAQIVPVVSEGSKICGDERTVENKNLKKKTVPAARQTRSSSTGKRGRSASASKKKK